MHKSAFLPRFWLAPCLLSCLFLAWLLCGHAQAAVTLNNSIANQAQASFVEAASSKNATLSSNKVKAVPPTTIRYYRDDQFSNEALASQVGRLLYVQAIAAACNADEDVVDKVRISITSKLTGDVEWFDAAETGPDTALFRIPRQIMTVEAGAQAAVPGDGMLQVQKNDTLMARIENCGSMAWSMLLIDPSGIVYDSRSNEPVAGAVVALIDVSGEGNGGNAGGPAKVFNAQGLPAPDKVTTGIDGRFEFPQVAPGRYRLAITPPPSYDFPSRLAPAALPQTRITHLYGSYGAEFPVNATTGAVVLDVPLDFDSSGLMLEKSVSRQVVEIADFLDYTLTVRNSGKGDLVQVAVRDRLPAGFKFEPGSLRVRGAKAADPVVSATGELVLPVGELAINASATVTFRVRVGPGALQGDGTSRGQAFSGKPLPKSSNTATARVKVQAGVFSTKGFVVGSVFLDCNASQLREADEAGIPGVRILMEDGTSAVTDIDGKYSFSEVTARTHVLRLDGTTLPAGAQIKDSDRSRFADLKNGELYKAEFAVGGCDAPVKKEIDTRRAQLARAVALAPALAPVPAPVQPTQPAPADLDVAALDNTLDFVGLQDGAVLGQVQTPVRVKGVAGARLALSVNGVPVPDTRVGRKLTAPERQTEVWEYIGIDLKPGANTLEVAQQDGFGNPRGTKRIAVTVAASAAVIELEALQTRLPADGKSMLRVRVRLSDANGVRVTAATPLTLEASRGVWQASDLDPREPGVQAMLEGGEAEYLLQAPREEGEAVVRVRSGKASRDIKVFFVPDLQPLIAAGLIEGAINIRHFKHDALAPARTEDGFEDQLRNVSRSLGANADAAARAAMFIKGKIRGDYLLTLGYESEKAPDTKLFRDIDPNAFYPVYGDGAVRSFDAQSTSKLYVRIARDRSWLLYGDFTPPPATPARNLGAYNRSLTGVREHYETDRVSVDAYASRASARQAIDEFPANGVSGPFVIRQRPMLANSERVEVVVRDRNQPALVLSATPLARLQDYEIEPVGGTLLLRAPIASLDPNLNPVSIRVTYEVDQGGSQFWVAGVNAQAKVSDNIEVGGTYATDRNPQDPATLKSVNTTVRLAEHTTLIAEVAESDKASLGKGRAGRVDFQHAEGNLEARVHAGRADSQFDNLSSSLGRGRSEAGARVAYRVDESTRLVGEAIHSADVATGAARDGVLAGTVTRFANGVQVEAGVRHVKETAPANITQPDSSTNSVRTKVTAPVPAVAGATVFAEVEQDVAHAERRTVAIGGDMQMAQGGRLYARHELISSLGSNYALNDSQQRNATVVGIDTSYMEDGRVFSEYRARNDFGGPVAEAAIGLRNLWRVDEGVAVSTSFERVQTLEGESQNTGIALTAAVELTTNPNWKTTARIEVRRSDASEGVLNTVGIAARLSQTLTFLGKSTVSFQHGRQSGGIRTDALLQTGLAYRALESLGLNALTKYEYRLERDTSFANVRRAVHIIAANLNYQAGRDTVYTLRYAGKRVHDQSAGISSQTSAHLIGGRIGQNLGGRWDGSLLAQMLTSGDFSSRQFGAGVEAGYRMREDLWMSAGYNFAGFTDRDLSAGNYTSKGVYVRMRYKFDERALPDALNADAGMQ